MSRAQRRADETGNDRRKSEGSIVNGRYRRAALVSGVTKREVAKGILTDADNALRTEITEGEHPPPPPYNQQTQHRSARGHQQRTPTTAGRKQLQQQPGITAKGGTAQERGSWLGPSPPFFLEDSQQKGYAQQHSEAKQMQRPPSHQPLTDKALRMPFKAGPAADG